MDIVQDSSTAAELTNAEMLDMRKMYETEKTSSKFVHPAQKDFEEWQTISNRMLPNARELCEQLRLILEPTKCTRLRGDYRTGRRINMKKVTFPENLQLPSIFPINSFVFLLSDHSIYCVAVPQRQNLATSYKTGTA